MIDSAALKLGIIDYLAAFGAAVAQEEQINLGFKRRKPKGFQDFGFHVDGSRSYNKILSIIGEQMVIRKCAQ